MSTMGIIFSNIYDNNMGELTAMRTSASIPFGEPLPPGGLRALQHGKFRHQRASASSQSITISR